MMPLVSSASHPVQTGHKHTQKPLQVRRQLTGSESSGCTALFVLNVLTTITTLATQIPLDLSKITSS